MAHPVLCLLPLVAPTQKQTDTKLRRLPIPFTFFLDFDFSILDL
jgi:hypothetical protein